MFLTAPRERNNNVRVIDIVWPNEEVREMK